MLGLPPEWGNPRRPCLGEKHPSRPSIIEADETKSSNQRGSWEPILTKSESMQLGGTGYFRKLKLGKREWGIPSHLEYQTS